VRQRADEHVRLLAPRRVADLQPVELQLLAREVLQPDRDLHAAGTAAPTRRTQRQTADLANQRRIRTVEPETDQLLEQHAAEHVRVVLEPGLQIRAERLQATRLPLPRRTSSRQIPSDRLAIPAGVARDRRLRPTPARQSVNLHIVLLGQHPHGSLRLAAFEQPQSWREPPTEPRTRALPPWGILVIRSEEETEIAGMPPATITAARTSLRRVQAGWLDSAWRDRYEEVNGVAVASGYEHPS